MKLPPDLNQLNDRSLLRFYRASQHPRFLGALYEKYYSRIYHLCLYWVKDPNHAFDLTQHAFLQSFDKLDQLKNDERYGAWLRRIAYNYTLNFLKATKKEQSQRTQFVATIVPADPEAVQQKENLLQQLEAALEALPVPTHELLRLKYEEDKSIGELQELYDLSESAVKMRLSRARNKLKALMVEAA